MGADVQPHFFFHGGDPQADAHVQHLGYHIGDHEGKDYGHDHRQELEAQLLGVAVEQAVGAAAVHFQGGEQPGGDHAPGAGHAVAGPDVHGLVQVAVLAEPDGVIAQGRGNGADDHGRQGGDEARGRGHRGQAHHHAGGDPQGAGTAVYPAQHHPDQAGGGRRGVGGEQGVDRHAVGRQGAAGVEPEPAHPEEAGPQNRVGDVMGFHGDLAETFPGADDHGEGQGRVTRGDVHHSAAGEIQDAHDVQPAALAPDPVGQGVIDQGHPDKAEDQKRLEAHPFHKGPGDQSRGDHREHHLERGKEPVGDGLGIVHVRQGPHAVEPEKVEPADEAADIGSEGQGVAVQDPLNPGQGHKNVTQG